MTYTKFIFPELDSMPIFLSDIPIELVEIEEPDQTEDAKTYTEEELNAHTENAYNKGLSRGMEEGFIQGELQAISNKHRQEHDLLINLHDGLRILTENQQSQDAKLIEKVLGLSRAIYKKIFSAVATDHHLKELEDKIQSILSTVIGEQKLSITINPCHGDDIVAHLKDTFAKSDVIIDFGFETAIKPNACEIAWKGGGATWNQEIIIDQIEEVLAKYTF
ncbi:MAG: FliH/SctL family protein [Alphaproteobacteria bacterium]|nr:FliH/SctL family protein [Alphaproteobacteria bacterium]